MVYPNLNRDGDQELLTITTKDVGIKELKNRTEKHDNENNSKSPKIDNDYYKKK